ncbi:hypothetical protein PYCCODRAFT_1090283 [Trametes coccinea BRFM310]|uniref:Uncharacterized protein n=1 Tax=Trametes coccinea (strain BRFM310) TaxID=1353009 RepID=A0A1Y2IYI8_TRAC3|nr:hypothetical protein PYCCODRAFT_1090283 [Trametes coccinea BRFM310]
MAQRQSSTSATGSSGATLGIAAPPGGYLIIISPLLFTTSLKLPSLQFCCYFSSDPAPLSTSVLHSIAHVSRNSTPKAHGNKPDVRKALRLWLLSKSPLLARPFKHRRFGGAPHCRNRHIVFSAGEHVKCTIARTTCTTSSPGVFSRIFIHDKHVPDGDRTIIHSRCLTSIFTRSLSLVSVA